MKGNKCEQKWMLMQIKEIISHIYFDMVVWIDVILCYLSPNVLSIKSKQKRMIARAPIESLRICSFCISSQFVPMYPSWHRHTYGTSELIVSRFVQIPPCLHGLSKHSLRSTQDFPSGVTLCPRAQLILVVVMVCGKVRKVSRRKWIAVNKTDHWDII